MLIQQQCKAEWISFGDKCNRIFMAKMKQRKAWTSIYHIKDQNGKTVEGFEAVSTEMTSYYKSLLGKQFLVRSKVDSQVVNLGRYLDLE